MDSSALAFSFFITGQEALLLEVKEVLTGELMMSAMSLNSSEEAQLSFYGCLPDACRALSKYLADSRGTRTLAFEAGPRVFLRDQQLESISELILDNILP